MTTVNEYIVPSLTGLAPKTRELYGYYLRLFAVPYGHLDLAEIKASHIRRAVDMAKNDRVVRRGGSLDGSSAAEHMIGATRRLLAAAVADDLVPTNVALRVQKPARKNSSRRPLTEAELTDVWSIASDDETIMLRWFLETGCRRGGLVDLDRAWINDGRQTVTLQEKGAQRRENPISGLMLEEAMDDGSSIYGWTRRRLDGFWGRVDRRLPWASGMGLSSHWLRHYAITQFEAYSGNHSLAAFFAGHRLTDVTSTYVKPTLVDLCTTWASLHGESHPLAEPPS